MKHRVGNPLISLRASHFLVAEVHCVLNEQFRDRSGCLPETNRVISLDGDRFRAYGHAGIVLHQAKFEVYAPPRKCAFPGRNRPLLHSLGQFGKRLCDKGYSLSHTTYMVAPMSVSPDGSR